MEEESIFTYIDRDDQAEAKEWILQYERENNLDKIIYKSYYLEHGYNPILYASYRMRWEIVEMLIDADADVNVRERIDGYDSIYYICIRGQYTEPIGIRARILTKLIEKGADPRRTYDKDEKSLLHIAWVLDVVQILIKYVDMNVRNKNDETPLFLACHHGYKDIVDYLLKNGADANLADKMGFTPLHMASLQRSTDIAKLILSSRGGGVDVNAKGKLGMRTPLHMACQLNNKEMIHLLVKAGANLFAKDTYGEKPVYLVSHPPLKKEVDLMMTVEIVKAIRGQERGGTKLTADMSALLVKTLTGIEGIFKAERG